MTDIANPEIATPSLAERVSEHRLAAWTKEARELVKLAGPLVVTQLMQIAILTTDVIMLGRVGKEAIAAAALGNTVFYFTWLIGMGPAAAVSPMIAQILG